MEEKKENQEEVRTEVTSVAKEEQKTGEKIDIPSVDELVRRAQASYHIAKQALNSIYPRLSSKQKNRVFAAVLEMPTDDLPVLLKKPEEKQAFALGQQIIQSRFLITQHHILEERKRIQEEEKETKKKPKSKKEKKKNVKK